jgi:hypothetical protein
VKLEGAEVSSSTQFEGRTAEEAVARARAALGDSGAVRCWKTRRGGVGGFFAREVFVASLTPPPGSEATRGKASRVTDGTTRDGSAPDGLHEDRQNGTEGPVDHLADLVEATSDPLSLQSLAIPADAFDQVLAEAEAALSHDPENGGVSAPDDPTPPESQPGSIAHDAAPTHEAVLRHHDERDRGESEAAATGQTALHGGEPEITTKATRPKPKAGPQARTVRPAPMVPLTPTARPARIPDLGPGLRSLGLPRSYRPQGRRPSLDALAAVVATLPVPPALPSHPGAVVAVVGGGEDLARAVGLVNSELALASRDVLRFDGGASDARLHRQLARRRASGNVAVVAVESGPGLPLRGEGLRHLQDVTPDYVLAAVSAQYKRVDVEQWIGELPTVDAIALWDLCGTRTPAELLGVCPIAFVDGEATSTLGWTLLLAGRAVAPRS